MNFYLAKNCQFSVALSGPRRGLYNMYIKFEPNIPKDHSQPPPNLRRSSEENSFILLRFTAGLEQSEKKYKLLGATSFCQVSKHLLFNEKKF